MDKQFNSTLTSMYNIYAKCYKTSNDSSENVLNTGCEDTYGIMTFFNDPSIRKKWNIMIDKEWTPCNNKIYTEFMGTRNAYAFLPYLIENRIRIVIFLLFSGYFQGTLIPMFRLSEPKDGLTI